MAVRRSIRSLLPPNVASSAPRGEGEAPSMAVLRSDRTVVGYAGRLRGRYLLAIDLVGIVVAAYLALALRFDRITGPTVVPASSRSSASSWRYGPSSTSGSACTAAAGVTRASPTSSGSSARSRSGRSSAWSSSTGHRRSSDTTLAGGVPALVLAHRAAPERRHPRRRAVRDPGGLRCGRRQPSHGAVADRRATLLYGAGETGVLLARSAERHPGVRCPAGRVPRR